MSERDDVDLDPPSDAEPSDTDAAREDAALEHRRHRRRLAAALANFLAPGAGHMAIRRYRRALAQRTAQPELTYRPVEGQRDNSSDSRQWGPVPIENLVGKVFRIWWSSSSGDTRYHRIGTVE